MIGLVAQLLTERLGPEYWIRTQGPLSLSPDTEPEPDIAVVRGSPRQALRSSSWNHPHTALLVVEVSDSTLAHDRTRKAAIYAAAGIAGYWIVNLVDSVVEVHRQPLRDETSSWGGRYAEISTLRRGDTVRPVNFPAATLDAADLLP